MITVKIIAANVKGWVAGVSEGTIQILSKGPAIIAGHIHLVDDSGHTIEKEMPVALCRCGKSDNMPFCDGISEGHMKVCRRMKS